MSICLITGVAGFIGSHIQDKLISLGHTVIGIDNLSTGNLSNLNNKTIFYNDDIINNLEYIFKTNKIDYVFHLAAQINLRKSIQEPAFDAHTNIYGSLNLIELVKKYNVKKFIFSSTSAVYDHSEPLPWTTNSNAKPASPYALGKFTVEKYLELINIPYAALRYSNVYGPRQNSKGECGVVSIFIDNMFADKELNVFGNGEASRDFIYCDDVSNSNIIAMNKDIQGIYNISSNTEYSVNEIIKLINYKGKVNYLPEVVGEAKRTKLEFNLPGWKPETNFIIGINKTLEWYENKYK